MPYINRPYRNRPAYMDYISRYSDPDEDMPPQTNFAVDLAPFPSRITLIGRVVFPKSQRKDAIRMQERDVRPDTVIYATGYTQKFDFLDPEGGYATAGEADIRNITKSGDESVAFIGFVRPGVGELSFVELALRLVLRLGSGAIPPLAEMQIMFWISLIKKQTRSPLPPPHYHLLVKEEARIKYGVDHSTYMSTLAKDIGAAPPLFELWREHGTHVLSKLSRTEIVKYADQIVQSSCLHVWRCLHFLLPTSWTIPKCSRAAGSQDRNLGHHHSSGLTWKLDHGTDTHGLLRFD